MYKYNFSYTSGEFNEHTQYVKEYNDEYVEDVCDGFYVFFKFFFNCWWFRKNE